MKELSKAGINGFLRSLNIDKVKVVEFYVPSRERTLLKELKELSSKEGAVSVILVHHR